MHKSKKTFPIVLAVTLLISYIAFFGIHTSSINLKGASEMRFGIDIRGGVDAAFAPEGLDRAPTAEEMEKARDIIEIRLDQKNILDRDITIDQENGFILVRFPWKTGESDFDPASAIDELGSMASLTFRDPTGAIILEGKHIDRATWTPAQELGSHAAVHLKLMPEGRELFSEATARLVGQRISIYMDDELISAPSVREAIETDECSITDISTAEEAASLSNLINSGALPFPMSSSNYSTISPMLGSNALEVMVTAGVIAFVLICLALIMYYRLSGVVASIALLLQVAGQIILLTWPQFTVTLSGIAGIILAVGMGVDANIIISERIREELRSGKRVKQAVLLGFRRAFSSVFDGNITVLIVALIMLIFGSGSILSFAFTLLFGIIMNFVAGVLATRLMMTSLVQYPRFQKTACFMSDRMLKKEARKAFPFYRKRKVFFAVSSAIMIFGIIMTLIQGVQVDIQFQGGAILQYSMEQGELLDAEDAGKVAEQALGGEPVTAQITTDYMTNAQRLVLNLAGGEALSDDKLQDINEALRLAYPEQNFALSEANNVAPFFSQRFLRNGIISLFLSMVLIVAYVWFSFRKIHGLSAGVMSLLSLLHDVLVVFFAFVIFRIPLGDSFIAVALTILGYSINDTIVIYDRIRENALEMPDVPIEEMVNKSISQSFTRSLNTNLAVFISVLLIYVFAAGNGLDSVRAFALPMCVGTISGCYSTVCIAGPLWTMWQKKKNGATHAA